MGALSLENLRRLCGLVTLGAAGVLSVKESEVEIQCADSTLGKKRFYGVEVHHFTSDIGYLKKTPSSVF